MKKTTDHRLQTTTSLFPSVVRCPSFIAPLLLLLLLIGCGAAPDAPTPVTTVVPATATSAQQQDEAPSPTNTLPPVQIVESEITQVPPATPTAQAVDETTAAPAALTTTFTDYRDDLLGVRFQRPVEWTPQFPLRSEITSFFNEAELQADPTQSYAVFRYEAVGRLEDEAAPAMPPLLLPYLQQNVSSDITIDALAATTLNGLSAARWEEQTSFADGVELSATEWLVYAEPLLYRLSTTAQVAPDGADYRPELQQMLDSLAFEQPSILRGVLQFGRYEPYLADNTFYSSSTHGIALSHPADAVVADSAESLIIASDERLLDGFDPDEVGYLVLYQELDATDAQPDITLAEQLIKLPDATARQVDRADVPLERYSADAIMYRNRPNNRFTYELSVYVIDQGDSQAAIIGIKFGSAAPAIWTEEVIGSLIFGP